MMTSSNGNIFRITGPLCGEFTGPGEFPTQRPVTRSFDVFFDLRLNKRLSKQPWGWWFETPSWSLWRHCNEYFPRYYCTGSVVSAAGTSNYTPQIMWDVIPAALIPRDLYLESSDRYEIWQAPRQHCCRGACQILKWYQHFNTQSRAFETLRDLTIRRLIVYWNGSLLVAHNPQMNMWQRYLLNAIALIMTSL